MLSEKIFLSFVDVIKLLDLLFSDVDFCVCFVVSFVQVLSEIDVFLGEVLVLCCFDGMLVLFVEFEVVCEVLLDYFIWVMMFNNLYCFVIGEVDVLFKCMF